MIIFSIHLRVCNGGGIYVLVQLERAVTTPTGAVGVRGSVRGGIGGRSAESRSDNRAGGNGRG